ncbi:MULTISPECIES: L,D-transpeptidase [Bacillus cereus group]|uniref:L,D-transpeptidase n=1 Tax=Bacillus cereus TaxID=1396 RepID=A0AA44Q7M8_BACCE|nr:MULTISPECIES: L,D-transpeptidase [Bacillus cereus group]PFN08571.1 L,D-transpeptidase [Bacillus cereus]PFO77905.1 L,D-transpeptidase [Bacillus cereus]PFR27096.1 L,D-transpeptidase [Bacillus cereus]PFR97251.1 L,D-transpeptidase [Bacillus cereus]
MKKVCFVVILFFCLPMSAFASSDHLILINLTTNQLSFFENGNYIKTFPVTTGKRQTPTPEGTFCIINKYKNKEYHRKKIPGGAPNNPLGTRWLGLNEKEYAIHGTNREGTIGRRESNGCIRMHDRDIQWLYERVSLQTKVIISQFYTSPEYAAHQLGYRVTSWSGRTIEEEQIGTLTLVDRMEIFWQEPNGQFTKVKTVLPNERYAVYSRGRNGNYYIGNNLYIMDETGEKVRYEQVPYSVLSNIYKRKYNVQ